MIEGLQRFVGELRRAGVSVSPAESIDAARAIEGLGIADRRRFRQALQCTLVKRAGEREIFDRLFERFFAAPARSARRPGRAGGGTVPAGGRPAGEPPEPTARPHDGQRESTPTRPRKVVPSSGRPSVERRSTREEARRWLAELRAAADRPRGRIRRLRAAGDRPVPASVPGPARRSDPARRDLSGRIVVAEEREIAAQVPRLVERIRLRAARRTRRAARGVPNIRSLFRENVRHGGIPFVLPRRRRRPRRARVVLLVDVSWSTARAAGLFLAMAGEFLNRAADTRVLLFVDRFVDATRPVRSWLRGGGAADAAQPLGRGSRDRRVEPGAGLRIGHGSFAALLGSLTELNLGAPSDYGRAFDRLSRSRRLPSGRQTVLVVLGDGRTNVFDPQVWAFEDIAARCGAVLWLVPEGIERWGTADSALDRYLPHVDVAVEARDLHGLAAGLAELVRRL